MSTFKSSVLRLYGPGDRTYVQQMDPDSNVVTLSAEVCEMKMVDAFGTISPVKDHLQLRADLTVGLQDEFNARVAAEQALRDADSAEQVARAQGDEQLQSNIDAEAAARAQGDSDTLSQAQSFATSAISDERAVWQQGDVDAIAAAKVFSDAVAAGLAQELLDRESGDASTLSSAQSYADGAVSAERSLRIQGDADTLASAQSFASSAVAEDNALWNARVTELLSALSTEQSDRAAGDSAAIDAAYAYTLSQVTSEHDQWTARASELQNAADVERMAREQGDSDTLSQARNYISEAVSADQALWVARTDALQSSVESEHSQWLAGDVAEHEFAQTLFIDEAAAREQGDSEARAYADSAVAADNVLWHQGDADTLAAAKSYTDEIAAPINAQVSALDSSFKAFTTGADPDAMANFIKAIQDYQQMNPDMFVQVATMQRLIGNLVQIVLKLTDIDARK